MPKATHYVHLKVLDIFVRVIEEFPQINEILVSMPGGREAYFNYEDVD